MKIHVVSRSQIKRLHKKDFSFHKNNWIISIYSSAMESRDGNTNAYSPLPFTPNILKLQFDDVTELEGNEYIHFNQYLAKKIVDFIKSIKDDGSKDFYVHCDAGVSRSGAVGYLLNEWFNKFISDNKEDDEFFKQTNSHIMPNPQVIRILKQEMFGTPFRGIEVNDYKYNSDRERIDNIELI